MPREKPITAFESAFAGSLEASRMLWDAMKGLLTLLCPCAMPEIRPSAGAQRRLVRFGAVRIFSLLAAVFCFASLHGGAEALVITNQPTSLTVMAGSSATLNVTATGVGLTYQWKKGGTAISGATNASLTLSAVSLTEQGDYSVEVTESGNTMTSDIATLTVQAKPTIKTQPVALTVKSGSLAAFSVAADGSPTLTYQWRKNGADITGATGATFTLNTALLMDEGTYSVAVSNGFGKATSSDAPLTVETPPTITSQPAALTVKSGSLASFSVTAVGSPPLTYQWKKDGTGISGATSATFTLNAASLDNEGNYTVAVANGYGDVTSNAVALTVQTPPTITAQPAALTVKSGSLASFSVTAMGSLPLSYQWKKDGSDISGATAATYTLNSAQLADEKSYSVSVTNAFGDVTSSAASLIVQTPPSITTPPTPLTVQVGASASLNVVAEGSPTITYQWKKDGANIPSATGSTFSLSSPQTTDSGSYSVVVANGYGSLESGSVSLKVCTLPSIITQPTPTAVNPGSSAVFSVEAGGTGPLGYQWYNGGTKVTGGTSATLTIPNAQSADVGSYSVVVQNDVGQATSSAAALSVIAPVVISASPQDTTIISGTSGSLSVTAAGGGALSYQWRKDGTNLTSTYQFVAGSFTWQQAKADAEAKSGHLATITSAAEWSKIASSLGASASQPAWIGAFQTPGSAEPAGGWKWVTGEAFTYTNWFSGKPDNGAGTANYAMVNGTGFTSGSWGDINSTGGGVVAGYILEKESNSATFSISPAQTTDAGAYDVLAFNGAGLATSGSAQVTVIVPPKITVPPVAASVGVGSLTTFSVTATGTEPLSYTWMQGGKAITGASGSLYSIASAQATDSGSYSVRVGNAAGASYDRTSASVLLTVMEKPVFDKQQSPISVSVPEGTNADFGGARAYSQQYTTGTVVSSGSVEASYQWLLNGIPVSGATLPTNQIPNAKLADAGQYTVVATTPGGQTTSNAVQLTVLTPVKIVNGLVSAALNVGTAHTLSVEVSGSGPFTYKWYKDSLVVPKQTTTTTATTGSFSLPSIQEGIDGGTYYVSVSNNATAKPPQSSAVITVNPPPKVSAPAPASAIVGGGTSFSVTVNGKEPILYQWRRDSVPLASGTSATLSLTNVQHIDAGSYDCKISTPYGDVTSASAQLTVYDPTVITAQPAGGTVNEGASFSFSVTATGSGPLSYQWRRGGSPVGSGFLLSFASVGATHAGKYDVVVSGPGGTVTSQLVDLSVILKAGVSAISANPSPPLQVGTAGSLAVTTSGTPPISVQWYRDGTLISGATSNSINFPSAALSDSGNYTVSVSNTAGSATSGSLAFTVYEPVNIVTQPLTQTVNPGTSVSLSVAATGTQPLTYQWYKGGAVVSGATLDTLALSNVSTQTGGTYSVSVRNIGGSLMSSPAFLTVNQVPAIRSGPSSAIVAVGSSHTFKVAADGTAPLTYQWRKGGVPINGATGTQYTIPSCQITDQGSYDVVVDNITGQIATSFPAFLTVLEPVVIVTPPASTAVANGAIISLSVTTTGTAPITYQWYKNGTAIPLATASQYFVPIASASDSGTYTVQAINEVSNVTSSAATVTVLSPVSITSQPQGGVVTLGGSYAFSVTASGAGTLSYQWRKDGLAISGATGSAYAITNATALNAGTYDVSVSNSVSSLMSVPATLAVITPPSIDTQPVAQTVAVGGSASFSVSASGSQPLAYQWRKDGTTLNGATASSYALTAAQVLDGGSYDVVVSNPAGSATSNKVPLSVGVPLAITAQPTGASILMGSALSASVSVSGSAPVTYQWRRGGVDIPGANSAIYSVGAAQASDAGDYDVVVSNAVSSLTSQKATFLVLQPVTITSQPASTLVTVGSAASLAVTATGTEPITYQWRKATVNIAGATSSTLSIPSAQFSDAGIYDVLVTNAAGALASGTATITVATPPVIATQPAGGAVGIGGTYTLSVVATGTAPLSYQWQKGSVPIAGATSSTYSITNAQGTDAGFYSVIVSNSVGSTISAPASVTIADPPVITVEPVSNTIAVGASHIFSVTATGTAPLTYKWRKDGAPLSGATAASYTVSAAKLTDAGTYSVVVSNAGGSATSSGAQLAVLAPPVITVQPVGGEVKAGSSYSLGVTVSGSAPFSYNWRKAGSDIPGATSSTYDISSAAAGDAGLYSVVVSNSVGSVTSNSTQVKVMQGVVITSQPASTAVVKDAPATFTVGVSGDGPITYAWSKDGAPIAGATGATYAISSAQPSDVGAYTVVVKNAVSSVTSAAADLSMMVPPKITVDPEGGIALRGGKYTLSVTATGSAPLNYQWYKQGAVVPGATGASYVLDPVQLVDEGEYSVIVTNAAGNDVSQIANVVVLEGATITAQPANVTCLTGDTISLKVTATGREPITYQWFKDGVKIPKATASELQMLDAKVSDAGTFHVVVTNPAGGVPSQNAVVTVIEPVTITQQPSSVNLVVNDPINLSVTATGTSPITYQWRKNGVLISNATSSTLSIPSGQFSDLGSYDVLVTNPAGTVTSEVAAVGVYADADSLPSSGNSPPHISKNPATPLLIKGGDPLSLSVVATGTAPLSYQWRKAGVPVSGGTLATFSLPAPQESDTGVYDVVVTNSLGKATSKSSKVTVVMPITITTQPASKTVRIGASATLSVTATGGAPIFYQWRKDGVELPDGTAPTLFIPLAKQEDAGSYDVVLSNAVDSVTSAAAMLAVDSALEITTQPVPATVVLGDNASLSVVVSGAPPVTYQWSKDGIPVVGGTQATLNVLNTQTTNAGSYSVVISNPVSSLTSQSATLTVITPVSITTHPQDLTVNAGSSALLSVVATGSAPLTYQWSQDGVPISGATSADLSLSPVRATQAGVYRVQVSNAAGAVTSNAATLTVRTAPSISSQPVSVGTVTGTSATFSVTASGTAPLSYQWRKGGSNLSGGTGSSLTLPSVAVSDAGIYDVVVSNVVGSATSHTATLSVYTPLAIVTQPAALTVSAGSVAAFSVSVSGSSPISYQWKKDGANVAGATGSTFVIPGAKVTDGGSYSVVATNPAGSVTSDSALLTVQTPVVLVTQPASAAVAPGGSVTFSVTATGTAPLTYQWSKDGVAITGATSASYTVANAQNADGGAYSIVVSNPLGSVTSQSATLNVITPPTIVVQPQSQTVTAGSSATLQVTASAARPSTYRFVAGDFTWTQAKADAESKGGHLATVTSAAEWELMKQTLGADFNRHVWLGASDASKEGQWQWVTGEPWGGFVNWSPGEPNNDGGQNYLHKYPDGTWDDFWDQKCTDGYFLEIEPTFSSPLSYQWRKDGADIQGATGSSLLISNAQTSDAAGYEVVVSNAAGSVTSDKAILTVVSPIQFVTQPAATSVSAGLNASFSVTVTGTEPVSYQWRHGGVNVAGGTSATLNLTAVQVSDAGSYDVVATNAAGSATSYSANLTVLPAVAITSQPVGGSVDRGATFTFSVTATGATPMTFQWFKGGTAIAGATSSSYVVYSATDADAGDYTVSVANAVGSALSNVAALSIRYPVIITKDPVGGVAAVGRSFSFTVQNTGSAPLTYQWFKSGTLVAGGSGAGATLTLSNPQYSDAGDYTVKISNSINSATSNPAPLTVVDGVVITSQPTGLTAKENDRCTLSVTATGTGPLTYQWRHDGVEIPGATADSYVFSKITSGDAGNYDVLVTNLAGTVQSQIATVFIITGPKILTQPVGGFVVEGGTFSFSVYASGSLPLTYQWHKNTANVVSGTTSASVSLFAGSAGTVGASDGQGAAASFSNLSGAAVDAGGNVYVADTGNHVIRKITPGGAVSTFAGTPGSPGSQDGTGTGANFNAPANLAVDGSGNVFVADTGNHTVRKITPSGIVTTFAGSAGASGFSNGMGGLARFKSPMGISVDDFGNVYVSDGNQVIRKISASGDVSDFAGSAGLSGSADGIGAIARFKAPGGIVVDGNGNVFVADTGNHTIRKVTSGGAVSTVAGSAGVIGSTNATGTLARFNAPGRITMDEAGNLFVSDTGNHLIRRITSAKVVTTVAGAAGSSGSVDGVGSVARFSSPTGIAFDQNGMFYVADSANNEVRKVVFDGSATGTLDQYSITNASAADDGDYTVVVSNGAGSVTSSIATLQVLTGVSITTQPVGGGALLGGSYQLSVVADGAPTITYQWRLNGVNLPGQTLPTLDLSNISMADYGDYDVVVKNQVSSVTSLVANVFYVTPPVIVTQPVGGVAGLSETFSMDVTATGTAPLTYEWRRSGVLVSSSALSSLLLSPVYATDAGSYTVTVRNPYASAVSTTVKVSVVDFSQPLHIDVPDTITQIYSGTLGYRGGLLITGSGSGGVDFTAPLDVPKQIIYAGTGSATLVMDQPIGPSTRGIVQTSNTSTLEVSGSTLTVNPSGTSLISSGSAAFIIDDAIIGAGTLTTAANSSGSITLGGSVNPSGDFINSGTGTGVVTVTGSLGASVTGVFENSWTSPLNLDHRNDYSSLTVVQAGALVVNADGALGNTASGTNVELNTVLDLRNVDYTLPEALAVHGGTVLVSSGTSSFAGGINVSGGTASFDIEGASLTVSGQLSGDAPWVKTGPGELIFTGGGGTGTGSISIMQGSLASFAPGSLGSGDILLYSEDTRVVIGGDQDGAFTNNIVGLGGLVKTGTGTVTLTGSNDFQGDTYVSSGTLVLGGSATLGSGSVNVGPNGVFAFNPTGETFIPNEIYGPVITLNPEYRVVWNGGPGNPGGGAIGGPKSQLLSSSVIKGTVGASLPTYTLVASEMAFSFSVGSLPPGLSYNSEKRQITGIPTSPGVTTSQIQITNPGGVATVNLTFVITMPPVDKNFLYIVTDPLPQVIPLGGSGSFKATVFSAGPCTYQWKKDGVFVGTRRRAAGNGEFIATLSLSNVGPLTEALFSLYAWDDAGRIIESNPALLTVGQGDARFGSASLLRQGRYFDLRKADPAVPVDLKTVAENDFFVVQVSIDPLATYSWYYSSYSQTDWILVPGQIYPIFNFSDPSVPKNAGGFLRLQVTLNNKVQTLMFRVQSYSAALPGYVVEPPTPLVTRHPYPVSVRVGGSASFSVFSNGYPVNYTWFREDPVTKEVAVVQSGRFPFYNINSVRETDFGSYFVVVTDYWGRTVESLRADLSLQND